MARTTNRPSTAARPNPATTPLDTNSAGSIDQPDQQDENGYNTERRENLTAVRDQPDNDGNDSRERRDDSHENLNRSGREFEHRDERKPHDGYTEQGSREQVFSAGLDAFAPVLEAWKQVFKSWSELTETMLKVQQDAFASLIGAANTTAKDIKVGDCRDGELAVTGSRTMASTSDRIERDRR